eukprot:TRINITY_DN3386_c1_g1_i3.p1 TRINITY_DN3386_c1_g1~~TRINITY_DN3386_c1_g1_i3.p1  ORF type:complete len:567 (+),score=156.45 TRINITY_DN3386_c1_g1_i3:76-1701(+)
MATHGDIPPPMHDPAADGGITYWVEETIPNEDMKFQLGQSTTEATGVSVISVGEGGAFHRAGVQVGQLLMVNGMPIQSLEDVKTVFAALYEQSLHTRKRFPIVVRPDPSVAAGHASFADHPPTPSHAPQQRSGGATPLDQRAMTYFLRNVSPTDDLGFRAGWFPDDGVHLIEIKEGFAMARCGVPTGKLVSVNDMPIETAGDVQAAFKRVHDQGLSTFPIQVIPAVAGDAAPAAPAAPRDMIPMPPPASHAPPAAWAPAAAPAAWAPAAAPAAAPQGDLLPKAEEGEDRDEFLARSLHTIALFRRQGEINDSTYAATRDQIMKLLHNPPGAAPSTPGKHPRGRDADRLERMVEREVVRERSRSRPRRQHAAPVEEDTPKAPLYAWGQTNKARYIYLRSAPERNADWAHNGGVYGVLHILHCVGDWMCVRTDKGVTGYIRARHVTYLPSGPPAAAPEPPPAPGSSPRPYSPRDASPPPRDLVSRAGPVVAYDPLAGADSPLMAPPSPARRHGAGPPPVGKELYDPYEDRWFRLLPSPAPAGF